MKQEPKISKAVKSAHTQSKQSSEPTSATSEMIDMLQSQASTEASIADGAGTHDWKAAEIAPGKKVNYITTTNYDTVKIIGDVIISLGNEGQVTATLSNIFIDHWCLTDGGLIKANVQIDEKTAQYTGYVYRKAVGFPGASMWDDWRLSDLREILKQYLPSSEVAMCEEWFSQALTPYCKIGNKSNPKN